MSNRELTLTAKLYADASRMTAGFLNGERGVKKFTASAKREFESLKNSVNSVEGKLASLGVTIGVTASIMQSANLDKELKLLEITAGGTADETSRLRRELFAAQKDYGVLVDESKSGVDALVAAGLSLKQATVTVAPVAQILAVAKTNANALGKAMGVASQQFGIDLSDPKAATLLLDQMFVAGKLGNAELENLPDIFARIGANSKAANFTLQEALALTETISLAEPDPQRLGTLVDSTLRLFTRGNYLKKAQKETGIKFFDAKGERRNGIEIISDIKKKYDTLKSSAAKFKLIDKAFGTSDAETIKGLQTLLDGDSLNKLTTNLNDLKAASGAAKRDSVKGLDNLPSQIIRASGALREAADNFAQPFNDMLKNIIKFGLDKKENGGLGMDGKDMLLATGGGALATILAAKFGGKAIAGIAGKIGGIGAGVATGKALETAAGVTPVYVVNMSEGGLGVGAGLPGMPLKANGAAGLAKYSKFGTAGIFGLPGLAVASAGLAGMGYGKAANKGINYLDNKFNTGIGDAIGRVVAVALAPFSASARQTLRNDFANKKAELTGTLHIKLDQEGRFVGASMKTNQANLKTTMANGPLMAAH